MIQYKWLSPKFERTMSIINPMLKILKKEGSRLKILDLGCGDGVVSEILVKLGYDVFGIDKDETILIKAKKRGIKTIKSDLNNDLPLENESFDIVWCLRSIEHIYYTEKFLKECYRVLKTKGSLIITADNINSLVNRIRVLLGLYPLRVAPSENFPSKDAPRFTDHVRCFNKDTLEKVLTLSGFKIEKITSDFVCFNFGELNRQPWSEFLGKIIPSLGETLIVKAKK